jgi:starch synthase
MPIKVLFAASKVSPFAPPGALADAAASLPASLVELGADVCVLTPAYAGALEKLPRARRVARFDVRGQLFTLWEGHMPDGAATCWLLDFAPLFGREGTPYRDAQGAHWRDNAWRFGCFCEAIVHLALGRAGLRWTPDLLHLNDWQTALAAAWLSRERPRPRTLFTIHHLDEQGVFGRDAFQDLWLLPEWWSPEAMEFHHGWSFLKAGINFSDALSTVSPAHAREIQTPESGHGLNGLLRKRASILRGVLCGIDERRWNPAQDRHLEARYDAAGVDAGKRANKLALQTQLQLEPREDLPLIAVCGRLGEDYGTDLLLRAHDELAALDAQIVVAGHAPPELAQALGAWAQEHPRRIRFSNDADERLLHQLLAGADLRLLPARHAPHGLYAMQALHYGTLPVASRTGGLADVVVDASSDHLDAGLANGFDFAAGDVSMMLDSLRRALALYADVRAWEQMQRRGMSQDFSWRRCAREYLGIYQALLKS